MGSVDFELLGALLVGSLPGIYLGSHLAVRIPEKVLRPSLAAILLFTGSKLLAKLEQIENTPKALLCTATIITTRPLSTTA